MTDAQFDIDTFLKQAVAIGASDVHLRVGEHPILRKDGKIIKVDMPKITDEDMDLAVEKTVPDSVKPKAKESFDFDYSYEIKGVSRFRVNLGHQMNHKTLVLRTIPYNTKRFEELGLPPAIEQFSNLPSGIVLVTGATGSGKSTTLSSLIDFVNAHYQKHIITIEDPIEFVFTNKKAVVTQRQVGLDTASFPDGVKYAMRQDPDVIFIGEIRDRETIESALKASETGHLVFSTIHTSDATQTINRIVNMFQPQDRDQVKKQLAATLKGTIAQKLVRKKGGGRVPACEVLVTTSTIKDCIEKGELDKIYDLLKNGSYNGMRTLNMSLHELAQKGIITEEEAVEKSELKNEIQQMFRGVYQGSGK